MQSPELPNGPLHSLQQQMRNEVEGRQVIMLAAPYHGYEYDLQKMLDLGASGVALVSPELRPYVFNGLPQTIDLHLIPQITEDTVEWRHTQVDRHPVRSLLDRLDPDGNAVILTGAPATWNFDKDGKARIAGRVILNARPAALAKLEDKTSGTVSAAQLPTPAHSIVTATVDQLVGAHRAIGKSGPTVWSLDAKMGLGSSGTGTVLVSDETDAIFQAHQAVGLADRVRVSEYCEGIPFGVQGFVDARGQVAILGIAEMLTAMPKRTTNFTSCGFSNAWQPDRRTQQAIFKQVVGGARRLNKTHGLVGGFSIDGILTAGGPIYTEVNARVTEGAYLSTAWEPALVWPLMQALVNQGRRLAIEMPVLGMEVQRLRSLEPDALVLSPGEISNVHLPATIVRPFTWTGSALVPTPRGEVGHGALIISPSQNNGVPCAETEVSMNSERLGELGSLASLYADLPSFMARALNVVPFRVQMAGGAPPSTISQRL